MDLPHFFGVSRRFEDKRVEDLGAAVEAGFQSLPPAGLEGRSVAVCVGSRGIASLPELVQATIAALRKRGGRPFIVPAMGSHGGATPEGQTGLLADLGVSEATMGVPVLSDMEVTDIGAIPDGPTVRFAATALRADYVVPVCRVKQHTMITGDVQSGLCKMLVIGCGKHVGAKEYHRHDIGRVLVPSAEIVIEKVPLLCGVAVVENACDHVSAVRVVAPRDFIDADRELLRLAQGSLPKLPIPALDALFIDAIGKDISGGGADVNVIGTWRRDGGARAPDYAIQAVLGITPASHGNAIGLGHMDIMPKRLLDEIDYEAMFINALTSGSLRAARTPLWVDDDRALLGAVLGTLPDAGKAAFARIRNTLDLSRFWVTEPAIARLEQDADCVVDPEPQAHRFDDAGRWLPFH